MVAEASIPDVAAEVRRRLSDMERLRGPLRIIVRNTQDGLGISIPPGRNIAVVLFLLLWLCGWAAGETFAIQELLRGPLVVKLFMLLWGGIWTLGGLGVMWVILWQLFGREQLFFTGGALVREWSLLGYRNRRVVMGEAIQSIKVAVGASDLAGIGTIHVRTAEKTLRIGSGLSPEEAEFISDLIRLVGDLPVKAQAADNVE